MSYRTGPRVSAVFDMERMDWIAAARAPLPVPPVPIFDGGPLEGVTLGMEIHHLPDWFEVEDPEGLYCPTITTATTGVYIWRPGAHP